MNVLIACHKPPGFNHENLYKLNINTYKRNRTRKIRKLRNNTNGNTVYYLDVAGKITYYDSEGKELPDLRPANNTPNWYPDWTRVPDNSIDMIWAQECPVKHPFWSEELSIHLNFEDVADAPFLDADGTLDDIWRNLLNHGKRILKEKGKIVVPLPMDGLVSSESTELRLIARIINMEATPDFLYKITVLNALSKVQKANLRDIFILKESEIEYNFEKAYKFLVFEKP